MRQTFNRDIFKVLVTKSANWGAEGHAEEAPFQSKYGRGPMTRSIQ